MDTRWIEVRPGLALAVDAWTPAAGVPGGPAAGVPGGPAATFVLVHGLASNARMWDGVAARLVGRGHPVVAVDLRGHGRSGKPDDGYDVLTVAGDLAALIPALGADRPVVAGQSWGGNVVLELAARHPELVAGIACVDGGWLELADAFPDWEACRDALAPPRLAGMPRTAIEARIRSSHPDWPEAGIQGALANFEVRPDGTVAPWLTRERHLAVLRGLWEHRPAERYPHVRVPVLLAPVDTGMGARAELRRDAATRALEALPQARLHAFRGDHDIHAQRPVELADVMLEHFAGGPAS